MNRLDELRSWYQALPERDRRILLLGGIALGVILVYLVILHPFFSGKQALQTHIQEQQGLVAWMRPAAAQIQSLRGQQSGGLPAGQSLLAVVDASAGQAGFGAALKQVQTGNDGSVRVQMQGVAFDNLVRWLGDLQQRYGVTARELTAQRGSGPGVVDASLTLVASGS